MYEELKIGKDMRRDEDLVACFREVMLLREQRKGQEVTCSLQTMCDTSLARLKV